MFGKPQLSMEAQMERARIDREHQDALLKARMANDAKNVGCLDAPPNYEMVESEQIKEIRRQRAQGKKY